MNEYILLIKIISQEFLKVKTFFENRSKHAYRDSIFWLTDW